MIKKKVQYLSDLHLEMLTKTPKIRRANSNTKFLVLAGDIGYPEKQTYYDFLKECSVKFKYVILISGNHEYYQFNTNITEYWGGKHTLKDITEIESIIRKITKNFTNIHYLQNDSITLDGITFYGSTFFSHIPHRAHDDVKLMINDFRNIYSDSKKKELLSIELFNELHKVHVESLIDFLDNHHEKQAVIIITHYCPIWIPYKKSVPELMIQINDTLNYAFCSEQSAIIKKYKDKIQSWIFGHTHKKHNLDIAGVRVCSNPKGYPGELYPLKDKYECPVEVFDIELPNM